ncbi:MAG: SDR family oxidoreductase [Dehalococcoidia bacterium]|nr:SDR family oxidoreductase [Dehalococcoidia bacterium]
MGDRLKGRVAIVTGAGRGIGRGEALALASEGCNVIVNDMGAAVDGTGGEATPAEQVVQEIKAMGCQALADYGNVVETETGERLVKMALDNFGRLDIVINNAGILRDRMLFNMTPEEWDAVIAVHLRGHFNLARPAAVYFRQERKGGVIINTSSTSGLGNPGQTNYAAAKEGIVGFTRTLARELGRYGVRANAIRPQAATRMTLSPDMKARFERAGEAGARMLAEIEKQVPEQVGPMVAWLCTDEAANVNGRTFLVRAGFIGLYSEPEIIASIESDTEWTVDNISERISAVTGNLVNEWPAQPPKE